jgi:hypothetical protein
LEVWRKIRIDIDASYKGKLYDHYKNILEELDRGFIYEFIVIKSLPAQYYGLDVLLRQFLQECDEYSSKAEWESMYIAMVTLTIAILPEVDSCKSARKNNCDYVEG